MTGEASVAEGRETPISCPSCGEKVDAIIVTTDPDVVHVIPCDHEVTKDALLRFPTMDAA